jgi:ribosomal protein S18 acetylase RimI-like enzyme
LVIASDDASTGAEAGSIVIPSIALRAASEQDLAFLFRIYASTREEELRPTGWSEEQKRAFLAMQFDAQHRYYHEHFPAARFDVIEVEGDPAGRFYVHRSDDEIRVIDIALLPEYRGAGIGGTLLRELQAEAASQSRPIIIHVEQSNPAIRLYSRLAFQPTTDHGVYKEMIWIPPGRSALAAERRGNGGS